MKSDVPSSSCGQLAAVAPVPLRERLIGVSTCWAEKTGRTLGSLSTRVTGTGKTLERLIEDPARAVQDNTLEKFAAFLADQANWPDEVVPEDAKVFAHVVGITLPGPSASAGLPGETSSGQGVAA